MLLNDESEYGHVTLHLYLQECAVARNVCNVMCDYPSKCASGVLPMYYRWSKFSQKCNQKNNTLWAIPMSKKNCVMRSWFMMIAPIGT